MARNLSADNRELAESAIWNVIDDDMTGPELSAYIERTTSIKMHERTARKIRSELMGKCATNEPIAPQRDNEDATCSHNRTTDTHLPAWEPDHHTHETSELIARKVDGFKRVSRVASERERTVEISEPGPFAVCNMGDFHIDDDGCDMPALLRDVETIGRTDRMYGSFGGDATNNWVGRLEKEYKKSSTTYEQAVQLLEWAIRGCNVEYLWFMVGNHDMWNQGLSLIQSLARGAPIHVLQHTEIKLTLSFPRGRDLRCHIRHDFKGHSIYNTIHGGAKESIFNPWGDVYISAHRHNWGQMVREKRNGDPCWIFSTKGYKRFDDYALQHQLPEHEHGSSTTMIVQPTHAHPCERVKLYHDVEEAADVLAFVRSRQSDSSIA